MLQFAFLTEFRFEPVAEGVALDAVAAPAYETPAPLRPKLRSLANLRYVVGRFRARVELSAASAAGTATLRLTNGADDLYSAALSLSSATAFDIDEEIDLSGVVGSQALRVVLDVSAAADAGTTARIMPVLEVEQPVSVVGC
jgi:hypothetical protein